MSPGGNAEVGRAASWKNRAWAVVMLLLTLVAPVFPAEASSLRRVLVVYDPAEQNNATAQWSERQLRNLLGHFDCQVTSKSSDSYLEGEAERYSVTFYLSTHFGARVPDRLLADLAKPGKKVCWLGYNAWQLTSRPDSAWLGFTASPPEAGDSFRSVNYRGQTLTRPDVPLTRLRVTDPSACQVLANAEEGVKSLPYAIRSKDFWVFADLPFAFASASDRYLVLCELLHDILGQPHPETRSALLRLEDISPESGPERLRTVVSYLASQRIPYSIGLIPVFRDPKLGKEIRLSQRPELVSALREAMGKGAAIVLHGFTHQATGRTAQDAEFWDLRANRPLRGKPTGWVGKRIKEGLRECLLCGLYPLLWETPHYLASEQDYREISQAFSTAYERRLVADDAKSSQVFPYLIHHDLYGQQIVPENLGHVEDGAERVEPLLERARALTAVRDGIASAYFHIELDLDCLRLLVAGLRGAGYRFEDLRHFTNRVKANEAEIMSVAEAAPLERLVPPGRDAWKIDAQGKLLKLSSQDRGTWKADLVVPGQVLVVFPHGKPPQQLLIARDPLRGLSGRAVTALVRWILAFSLIACALLLLLFGREALLRRRALR